MWNGHFAVSSIHSAFKKITSHTATVLLLMVLKCNWKLEPAQRLYPSNLYSNTSSQSFKPFGCLSLILKHVTRCTTVLPTHCPCYPGWLLADVWYQYCVCFLDEWTSWAPTLQWWLRDDLCLYVLAGAAARKPLGNCKGLYLYWFPTMHDETRMTHTHSHSLEMTHRLRVFSYSPVHLQIQWRVCRNNFL